MTNTMTKRERVQNAISHLPVDKVPKGEIAIDIKFANRYLGGGYSESFQDFDREKAIRDALHMDYVNVGDWPSWQVGEFKEGAPIFESIYGERYVFNGHSKHIVKTPFSDLEEVKSYRVPDISKVSGTLIQKWVEETDYFVFAQIGGPISMLNEMLGMEDYLVYCMTDTELVAVLAKKVMEYEIAKAKLFIDHGAHGILLADDMAFNSGLLLPPTIMKEVAFPFYEQAIKEIKDYKDVPIMVHTDGNINLVLNEIVKLGFDGVHSLQPSAGMNIRDAKKDFGKKLCLMGNIDLDYIMTFASVEEVKKCVEETLQIATPGSGFILGTCNTLVEMIPDENAKVMYETAEQFQV